MAPIQTLEAWEYNPSNEDHRCEHKYSPNRPVSSQILEELGVLNWKIDVEDIESNPLLEKIKLERGYQFWETVTVSPDKLENYDAKLAQFFTEHLHPYDESRLILEGSGLWDIRGCDGNWIRFRVEKGDMIVLPPGMYHRFTLDTHNYIKALLLYTEIPTRIDVLKPDGDDLPVRKEYIENFLVLPFPDEPAPPICKHDDLLPPMSTLSLQEDSPPFISTKLMEENNAVLISAAE
eukprot:c6338_g1_i1 orf=401-1105(-)